MGCHFLLQRVGASLVAQLVKNLSAVQETRFGSLGGEDLLEKEMANHSNILPGKSHGPRSLAGCSPWVMKESGTTEQITLGHWSPEDLPCPRIEPLSPVSPALQADLFFK